MNLSISHSDLNKQHDQHLRFSKKVSLDFHLSMHAFTDN
jgi:hypothetical protein